ncbi:TPA: Magnesium transporter NIPA4 [Trebouxia sp. C0004]
MQHTAAAQARYGDRRHRQLDWRSFIKQQQAYSAICKTISGGNSDTIVAYGDAKFSSSCCKGNPSTPTVPLRRKLGHCCQVYNTDEFRTSKLCCACKTAMDGMPPPRLGNPGRHAADLF